MLWFHQDAAVERTVRYCGQSHLIFICGRLGVAVKVQLARNIILWYLQRQAGISKT